PPPSDAARAQDLEKQSRCHAREAERDSFPSPQRIRRRSISLRRRALPTRRSSATSSSCRTRLRRAARRSRLRLHQVKPDQQRRGIRTALSLHGAGERCQALFATSFAFSSPANRPSRTSGVMITETCVSARAATSLEDALAISV